jgi:hypothetical protein
VETSRSDEARPKVETTTSLDGSDRISEALDGRLRAARPPREPSRYSRDREKRHVAAAFDYLFEQQQRDGIPSRHPGGVNGARHAIWASWKPHRRLH